MSDFQTITHVKRTAKDHVCNQCGTPIEKGLPAINYKGSYEGYFYCEYDHVDCNEAAREINHYVDAYNGEPYFLHQVEEIDEAKFLLEKFPAVAARLPFCQFVAEENRLATV